MRKLLPFILVALTACATKPKLEGIASITADDTEPDLIVFKKGRETRALGYDVEPITHIESNDVYLFRSYSCGECGRNANLVVYSYTTDRAEIVPAPGEYTASETVDGTSDFFGFYGQCSKEHSGFSVVTLGRMTWREGADEKTEYVKRTIVEANGHLLPKELKIEKPEYEKLDLYRELKGCTEIERITEPLH